MSRDDSSRVVKAVHGTKQATPDPAWEVGLSDWLRATYGRDALVDLYARYSQADAAFDGMMRRAIVRAVAKRVGSGLTVMPGVGFKHLETFEIGDGVFLGACAYLQGRFDGRLVIGNHVWVGPHAYFDARDLVLEEYVGWGPGAKVLGSEHTGLPVEVPVIATDLVIRPVRICAGADIGVNAVILPGITVGRGAIVGAGAVITADVAADTIVAGVPARILRHRSEPRRNKKNRA